MLGRRMTTTTAALAMLLAFPQQHDGIEWQSDLEAARALSAETGRPLLAVFRCEP